MTHLSPLESALKRRVERVSALVGNDPPAPLSLVITLQAWSAPDMIAAVRCLLGTITPEQARSWCSRMTRTIVLTGSARACSRLAAHVCMEGRIGLGLATDAQVEALARALPAFQGRSALASLDGLTLAGHGGLPARCLKLDTSDDNLAATVVDLCHILAESVLLMDEPANTPLLVQATQGGLLMSSDVIYGRVVPHRASGLHLRGVMGRA